MRMPTADDHARIAFTDMQANERQESAVQVLRDAVAYYGTLGVTIKRAAALASWQHHYNWYH